MIPRVETQRLLLREWRPSDFDAFAAFHADPDVARFVGGVLDRGDAWRTLASGIGQWHLRGYGPWAVERKSDSALLGRAGLNFPEGWPGLEVGWTFGKQYWGQGYATEAAEAALRYAFLTQPVDRVISCIDHRNIASQGVARRIGETKDGAATLRIRGEDIPVDIWSITRAEWQRRLATQDAGS